MAKLQVIKKSKEFRRIFRQGCSVADDKFVLIARKNDRSSTRFGFSISKKIGNAVTRNRLRRVLKEVCRLNTEMFLHGYDYMIIARKGSSDTDFHDLKSRMECLVRRLRKKL